MRAVDLKKAHQSLLDQVVLINFEVMLADDIQDM